MNHGDENEAQECCKPIVRQGYTCGECGDFHTDNAAAAKCCFTGVRYCPICDERWFNDNDENICEHIDFDLPPEPTPLQLEAYGQQRMLP